MFAKVSDTHKQGTPSTEYCCLLSQSTSLNHGGKGVKICYVRFVSPVS